MIQEAPRRHFHDELDALQTRLLEMAGMVEELFRVSTEALIARDPTASSRAKAQDDFIDEIEMEIDERVMELLALQQPMAKDLRQIITTLKVANDLERVGDHSVNIAKAAKRISEFPLLPEIPEIPEMVSITSGMLSDALTSFVARNPVTARNVCATDDQVDNLRRSVYRLLVKHMLDDAERISGALELLLVAQNLERVADLSTNIAEDVVFLVEGQTIKHNIEEA